MNFISTTDLVKANDRLYESNNHYSVDITRFDFDMITLNSSLVAPEKVICIKFQPYVF